MKTIKFFTLVLLCTAALQSLSAQDMTAKNKATVLAAYDALNHRDWNGFAAVCTDNFTDLNVGPGPTVGVNAALDLYKQFFAAFPDFKIKINEILPASSTRFVLRVTVTGTNTGPFMMLPATGKSIKFDDVDMVELNAAGKCISHSITNTGEALRQIGYGSLANPNTGVIMAAYQKFGSGDIPGLLAMCDDNVVFEIQDRMFDSKPRVFMGKAGVGQFFQEIGSKFHYSKFQPTRFVSDGDDVFILIDAEYLHVASGKTYTSTYTHHFKVVNGKITSFRGVDDFQMMK